MKRTETLLERDGGNDGNGSRGREADEPHQIPPSGWNDILLRVKKEQSQDNLSIVAAGVAFYAILALFPDLGALVSICGLTSEPGQAEQQLAAVRGLLPSDASQILQRRSCPRSDRGILVRG
ncbi:MAG: YhjD/YihY/BrkB family envelope integrity protein [bacterium]